jgi:ribose-phosphate pyrophosphokinase
MKLNHYPSGELRLETEGCLYLTAKTSDELVATLLTVAAENLPVVDIPYFPYAREDKPVDGRVNTLKGLCKILNLLGCHVNTYDLHSYVPEMLLNSVTNTPQWQILDRYFKREVAALGPNTVIVAPDKGASAKAARAAEIFGLPLVQGYKVRNTATGALSGFEVDDVDLTGKTALVLDDICDGGGTFLGLAKKLREKGAETLILYVTHGLFTKGLESLLNTYNYIWTTNTVCDIHNTKVIVKEVV